MLEERKIDKKRLTERWTKHLTDEVVLNISQIEIKSIVPPSLPFLDEVENGGDLRGIMLAKQTITNADFRSFNLDFATFEDCTFVGCQFDEGYLPHLIVRSCIFESCSFFNSWMMFLHATDTHWTSSNLTSVVMVGSHFVNCQMSKCDLSELNLIGANDSSILLADCKTDGIQRGPFAE